MTDVHTFCVLTAARQSPSENKIMFHISINSLPRLLIIILALFTNFFSKAFASMIWPFLGFFLMPLTTLMYTGAMIYNGRELNGIWLVAYVFGILFDLSFITFTVNSRRVV